MTDNRFQDSLFKPSSKWIPLAERMRPRTLDEIVGQDKAFGKGTLLRKLIEEDKLTSLVYGPAWSWENLYCHGDSQYNESTLFTV